MKQSKFKDKITVSHGRNGYLNTIGIQTYVTYDRLDTNNQSYKTIRMYPITSRDVAGNCWIEIPIDHIPELIEQLQTYVQSNP